MSAENAKLPSMEKAMPNPGLDDYFVEKRWPQVYNHLKMFDLKIEDLQFVMRTMEKEMERGLMAKSEKPSCLKMLPSFVRHLPDGSERGPYLAMDLGGTNFRVLLISLESGQSEMINRTYRIPNNIMHGKGVELFRHIAGCLREFVLDHHLVNNVVPLGFTFSFPCKQNELNNATLISWTKGFNCSDVVGQNVVQMLQEAIDEFKDVRVKVVAIVNDTVGTQMALAYQDHDCHIGLIVGTGSNACYTERVKKIKKLPDEKSEEMIINIEWAGLGENGCIDKVLTSYDKTVDQGTINPGKQRFEKLISGMYMGELVRVVLEDLVQKNLLLGGKGSPDLFTPGKFSTKHVSEVEADLLDGQCTFTNTYGILEDLGVENITSTDCAIISHVCALISTRASNLCAAGIACLINRMHRPKVTVGVDGSVFRFHPNFETRLHRAILALCKPSYKFDLKLSEDGSGLGAALVAAVAWRVLQKEKNL